MTTAYFTHPHCARHDMGRGHAECPERIAAINDALIAQGVMPLLESHRAEPASREQLARVHDRDYIEQIFALAPQEGMVALDPDTSLNPYSLEAALLAAGAVIGATDRVLTDRVNNAFCNVRPPGHHAERDCAMGFCFFNNIAIGAAHALAAHGLERVAVLDFDVHHGNGTEDIFRDDERVLICQTFQSPLYPGTGEAQVAGHLINCALPAGAGGEALQQAVKNDWLPALEAFEPQMLFISAGFDAHGEDPLAQLRFHEHDYGWVTKTLMDAAQRHCKGRIVSSLEGGYNLQALGRCAVAHVKALLGALDTAGTQ